MIDTRPTPSSEAQPTTDTAEARSVVRWATWLFGLVVAGGVLELAWIMLWPLSYRLTHGNDFTYNYLVGYQPIWERLYKLLILANNLVPGIEPPQSVDPLVNALVLAFLVAAVGYLAGLVLLDRGAAAIPGAGLVIVGFSLIYQVTLFLLPGLFTADIFSYVMYGDISAVYGLNPYIYPPSAFPYNPILEWIHPIWRDAVSVYGPLWTDVGWLMALLIRPLDLVRQVFAYKLLMNVVHLVNLGLVWWLLGRVRLEGGSERARLTAFAVFAWNPLVLFDVAGNAHNDALMVTLLLVAFVPLARLLAPVRTTTGGAADASSRLAWFASLLGIALSALVKYTSGLVGVFILVGWMRRLTSWRARGAWLALTAAAGVALAVAAFWPWLKLPEVLDPVLNAAGGKLYNNSLPDLVALTIADQVLDPIGLHREVTEESARFWMKAITRGLFGLYLVWEVRRVWRAAAATTRELVLAILEASVRAFLVLLLVVLTWVLEWYFLWPLALATLLGWRRTLTKVTVLYTLTSLPVFYYHHYWSWHMPGWVLFLYAVPPLLVPLGEWALSVRKRTVLPAPEPVTTSAVDGVERVTDRVIIEA